MKLKTLFSKNKFIFLIITVLSIILTILAWKNFVNFNQNSKVKIIASYKGGVVNNLEVQSEINKIILNNQNMQGLTYDQLTNDQKELIVKEVILKKEAAKDAIKEKLHKKLDYLESVRIFKEEILKQALYNKIKSEAISEKVLNNEYNELKKNLEGKDEFRLSYISLDNKKDADNLYKILSVNPKLFVSKAKNQSIDKETGKNGGDIGFVIIDNLNPKVGVIIKNLNKNKITKPIEIDDKWAIFKITDKRKIKISNFEDIKPILIQKLGEKAIQNYILKILENIDIQMNIN